MRKIFFVLTILVTVVLSNCGKTDTDPVARINCDGLVTDTAGTGDNGLVAMPNAFTPNGDGLNDFCRPYSNPSIASIVFTIYDGNNSVIFTTTQLNQGWQTTSAITTYEKYYYRIQAITKTGHKIGLCGDLYKLACFPAGIPLSTYHFEDQLRSPGQFVGPTVEHLTNCP